MARPPRPSAVALDRALGALARRVEALATKANTARGRAELAALRRALATVSAATHRVPPEPANAIGFVSEASTDWDEPDHGQDVEHDHGADAPEARRP